MERRKDDFFVRYRTTYVLNNISTPQCLREAEKLNTIKNAQTKTHSYQ